ncbi:MAG TPA: winged helix-turn-helix domain-containing protein, partial [Pseudonocardia sp.]|nr:winged helix-turn-helix domain-containing protein [Pseudonocardia sp.]
MLFRVLGPLEVVTGDGVVAAPAGRRARALLAALLLQPGATVPVHALADAAWAEDPPHDPANSLHVVVGRLRRALGPAGSRIVTRSPGYL